MADPQSWNGYSYGLNSPMVFVDPDGLDPCAPGSTADTCVTVTDRADPVDPWGPGGVFLDFFRWTLRGLQTVQDVQQKVAPVLDAINQFRRGSNCANTLTGGGAVVGGVVGNFSGTLVGGVVGAGAGSVEPGGGTVLGGIAGASLGRAGGTLFGAAGGGALGGLGAAIICNKSAGDGGGSGASSGGQEFWNKLKPFRGKTKTNGLTGKARRFFEWDHTHGDIEVYDARGRHLEAPILAPAS